MRIAPDLGDALETAAAFVVSGFNTMQDARLLDSRLDDLERALDRLPVDAVVYYEEAGFYIPRFSERVRERLLPRIDVLGMNEDELQERIGRSVKLRDPDDVARAIADVHERIPAPALVVHAASWAVAVGLEARRYADALESAVCVAATRYRVGDDLTFEEVERTRALERSNDGHAVVAGLRGARADAIGVPGFVVETPTPTTIGLGDTFVGGFLAALPR
jgi:ADP-dependent phosphofructokinase/glucokinase